MGKQELDNLVMIGKLKAEPPSRPEYNGMLTAARTSLTDAQKDLDPDSKFTLAYGAAHRLALAALRREGYRSEVRISVFQTLVHTLGTSAVSVLLFSLFRSVSFAYRNRAAVLCEPRVRASACRSTRNQRRRCGRQAGSS